jgi:uncharacterized protein (DUF2141 family)
MGLYSCASTGRPQGGPKDRKPPVLDTLKSTADKQLNFKPKELVFYFDEFVEVKDPIKQILVSPPLTYIPKVDVRGKRVTFKFDEKEVLREQATYTINFGESLVDFHEGNKLENFTRVFSTGAFLDSLNISGKIINAKTYEPENEMVVFLYDRLDDTIVRKEKPFYFAKPDKEGNFIFRNIKADTFRLFAIKDENINYKYDLESERIAFLDSFVVLTANSKDSFFLKSSLPIPDLKLKTKELRNYGKLNLTYNTTVPEDITYKIEPNTIKSYADISGDSINIFYDTDIDSFYLHILKDTLKVKPKGKTEWMKKSKFRRSSVLPGNSIVPNDSITLILNLPLQDPDFGQWKISDTIGVLDDVKFKLADSGLKVVMKYPWVAGETYTLTIDSGLVSSIYGHTLDSTGHQFVVLPPDKTAKLNIAIKDLDKSKHYILNVYKDQALYKTKSISASDSLTLVLSGLVPEKYNIEIFQDDNQNGIWDPADYDKKMQPENYYFQKGERLRENRDTDVNISWRDIIRKAFEPKEKKEGLPNSSNPLQIRR